MRASEPTTEKYKKVCKDFPNLAILTKSATPGKVQLTFGHAAVGNKSLGESVVAFTLAGDLISPSVVSLKIDITFAADGDKIRLPNRGSSPLRRRRRPCATKEAAGLDAAQSRPPPEISHGGRNPPQGVRRGRAPGDFRSLHHGVGKGRGNLWRGRRRKRRRQRSQRGGRGQEDTENR